MHCGILHGKMGASVRLHHACMVTMTVLHDQSEDACNCVSASAVPGGQRKEALPGLSGVRSIHRALMLHAQALR